MIGLGNDCARIREHKMRRCEGEVVPQVGITYSMLKLSVYWGREKRVVKVTYKRTLHSRIPVVDIDVQEH